MRFNFEISFMFDIWYIENSSEALWHKQKYARNDTNIKIESTTGTFDGKLKKSKETRKFMRKR